MRRLGITDHTPETAELQSSRHVAQKDTADERLAVLYRRHSGPLLNYLVRLTLGDRRLAEDILQETYLRAWHFIQNREADVQDDDGDPQDRHSGMSDRPNDVDGLRPWLYLVARRLFIDALRKRKARPTEVILTDLRQLPGPDDQIERMLVGQTVRAGLQELRSEHRDVLIESYYRGRSSREIAAMLDIPEGTVKSRTFYALRALRRVVDPQAAS